MTDGKKREKKTMMKMMMMSGKEEEKFIRVNHLFYFGDSISLSVCLT